jgi:hypothetical protein
VDSTFFQISVYVAFKFFVFILLSFSIILCLKGFFHTSLEECFILSRTPCAGFNKPTGLQIPGNSIPYTAEGRRAFPVQPVTVKPAVFDFTAENEYLTGNITRHSPLFLSIRYNQIK